MRVKNRKGLALATAVAGALIATGVTQAVATPPAGPDLRADANRDGRVDVSGDSDTPGEDTWTSSRGAILLPNIDDDTKRCPLKDTSGKPLTDAQLAACHDASDNVVNGARDAHDLARLRSVPRRATPAGATGTVTAVGPGASRTRLFIKRDGRWTHLKPTDELTRSELRAGVELGIEAKDVRRDAAAWDGRVTIRLTVTHNGSSASDDVTMRVAPVLTHHHLQQVQQVMVKEVTGNDEYAKFQREFVKELAGQVKAAGIDKPLKKFTEDMLDVWVQDFFEPGYAAMPGPDGKPRAIRVMIRSAQPERTAGRELYEKVRGPGVGVIQVDGVRDTEGGTLDSMGNLETIPPHRHNGKNYPAGRIIMGHWPDTGEKPAKTMRDFLSAQGMQSPLLLDTSWLHVGHVDEFIQFLPADTPRGWRIGVADPEAGMELLRKAQREGHGDTKMFSAPDSRDLPAPKETINRVLASSKFAAGNKLAADRIRANLDIIKRETGVTDSEIVRVPSLYSKLGLLDWQGGRVTNSRGLVRLGPDTTGPMSRRYEGKKRSQGQREMPPIPDLPWLAAYVPGAINGVVLTPKHYLAPKQWGPVINGKDIFTRAVSTAYRKAGFKAMYIDDYHTYHRGMGEVHCGTNTLRETSAWWPGRR
ncbi:protein-arginine deiminase domain-containing protein [Streptomyces sp. NPDC055078]